MNLLGIMSIFIFALLAADGIALPVRDSATKLKKNLSKLLESATDYKNLSTKMKLSKISVFNKSEIESDIRNLEKLFNDRLVIARQMAKYAESKHNGYTNKDLTEGNYNYLNAVGNESIHSSTNEFEVPVTLNESAVQTPTDLYQYTFKVLNSIKWTEGLDKKFRENYESDNKSIKAWQYIGLSNGVYRFYPGASWHEDNSPLKYYDVRQRSWYIIGSTAPKDMVIIIDLSGSVIGNRLLIIKSAVMQLLDTLQENDFVTIVTFNKNAHYLKDCWKYLVQATERNKKILKDAVRSDTVKGTNVANVDKGFKLAFETLKNARKFGANSTSNCTQTIAFFTDGVEGDTVAEDVFNQYNNDKHVRVFTYLVGRDIGSPFEAVKWIACENKGFFYRIETLSDVRQNIVKYVSVLSRSRADNNPQPMWTPIHSDALGLGMISALVIPIFNGTRLLGVLGSDVRLEEMLSKFPEHHLGAGGYPFSITNNGLVFFHPFLEKEEGPGLKPSVNVYLSEFLHHFKDKTKTQRIAKAMIDREKKFDMKFDSSDLVLAKYNDKFRIVERHLKYFYDKIANTSFSVGIAVTDYGSKVITPATDELKIKEIGKSVKTLESENVSISIGENWPYCPTKVTNWIELKGNLTTNLKNCTSKSKGLIDLVINDITTLEDVGWGKYQLKSSEVQAIFFGTTSGLTFHKALDNIKFKTSIKQEYFERAADSLKEKRMIFSAPNSDEVHVSRAVVVKKDDDEALWGVVGIHLNSTYLDAVVRKECGDDEDVYCYLVDENGFVVSSKKEEENSQFFGKVEGNVMEDLINKNVYQKYNFTDVRAMCNPSSEDSSSSIRLMDPFFSLFNYAKWWTQTIALSLIQYSLYAVMTGQNQVKAEDDPKPCFKKRYLYYRNADNDGNAENESIVYRGCQRSYESSRVDETNLLLIKITIENSTVCKDKVKDIPTEEEDNLEESCDLVDHYRVYPAEKVGSCVPTAKEPTVCSSAKLLLPSIALLVILQLLMILIFQKE